MLDTILIIVLRVLEILPLIISKDRKHDLSFSLRLMQATTTEEKERIILEWGKHQNGEQA
jgi:hypothetical protein